MFRFEDIYYLNFLWIIPALLLLFVLVQLWNKKNFDKLGESGLISRLMDDFSKFRHGLKFGLLVLSILLMVISYANPQWGNKKEKIKAMSSDIFIALDISQSMMSEDVSPNRLERAKRLATNLIESLAGNRIGLIYFAGNAYLQMPLSNDYGAAEIFVKSANTGQAGTQGTAIADAIELAERAFQEDVKHQRALIVITDGEDHDESAIIKAREARDNGLVTFTIGVGTEEGGLIPFEFRGREQYKKDEAGNTVRSKLNIDLLKDLSEAGGGEYYLVQEGDKIITDIQKQMDRLEKQEVEQRSFSEYASYFQYFLAFGLLFMVLEYFISNRSVKKRGARIFNV